MPRWRQCVVWAALMVLLVGARTTRGLKAPESKDFTAFGPIEQTEADGKKFPYG